MEWKKEGLPCLLLHTYRGHGRSDRSIDTASDFVHPGIQATRHQAALKRQGRVCPCTILDSEGTRGAGAAQTPRLPSAPSKCNTRQNIVKLIDAHPAAHTSNHSDYVSPSLKSQAATRTSIRLYVPPHIGASKCKQIQPSHAPPSHRPWSHRADEPSHRGTMIELRT